MKICESSDGSVKVVELDPAKWYWLVIPADTGINVNHIQKRDGMIFVPRSSSCSITFLECTDRILLPRDENEVRDESAAPGHNCEFDIDTHFSRVCLFCTHQWLGLHCKHDGYQNECPNCNKRPTPVPLR